MNTREKNSKIISFLWNIAEDLRDAFKKSENQNVVLPFVVLRRIDYVLKPTKDAVLEAEEKYKGKLENRHDLLCRTAGYAFYNKSPFTFDSLLDSEGHQLKANLKKYIAGFSENIQTIYRRFDFDHTIERLDEVGLLYRVMSRFNEQVRPDRNTELNLAPYDEETNPGGLNNHEMGTLFEELIRRYNEDIKENPGEHFTPKDVIRLLVRLTLSLWPDIEKVPGVTVADSTAGTGGILTIAREEILTRNPDCKVHLFGQELNPFTWAICKSDLLIIDPSEKDPDNIKLGSSLSNDQHSDKHFDLQFANPPYGDKWERDEADVRAEAKRGYNGRFGAGLPRISDGQLLFLQHKLFHMNPEGKPSFAGIVFNGSPLFTGEAGSGESEVRRWVLENDRLYALIALPEQIFYNTGIQTYLWILTNQKPDHAKGKVLLLNASGEHFWTQMPKSVGAKRRNVEAHIDDVLEMFTAYEPSENAKIFETTDFGYRRIQVERPLRLNFQVSAERLDRVKDVTGFQKLATSKKRDPEAKAKDIAAGKQKQEAILAALGSMPTDLVQDAEIFAERLDQALNDADLKLTAALKKAITGALAERDEAAKPVIKSELACLPKDTPEHRELLGQVKQGMRPAAKDPEGKSFYTAYAKLTNGISIPTELRHQLADTLASTETLSAEEWTEAIMQQFANYCATTIDERHGFYGLDQEGDTIRIVDYEPDSELRDHENVPLDQNVDTYFEAEVEPHVPDAWINPTFVDHKDGLIGKVGYSINFNRYFYRYQPPRDLDQIDTDIKTVEGEILDMLKEVTA